MKKNTKLIYITFSFILTVLDTCHHYFGHFLGFYLNILNLSDF